MSSLLRVQNPHVRPTALLFDGLELHDLGHFVPGTTAQRASVCLRRAASPLLEEERNPCLPTLIFDRLDPAMVNRARSVTGLAAHDDPVDSTEFQRQRSEQWFDGQESNRRRNPAKVICPKGILLGFDRHSDPYV